MFKRRIKIKLLFKSGREIDVTCKSYSFKFDNSTLQYCGYKFDGIKPILNFNPYELEGYVVG